jgi:hypothetical protein
MVMSDTAPTSFLMKSILPITVRWYRRGKCRPRALVMKCRVVSNLAEVAQANFINGDDQYTTIIKAIVLVSIPSRDTCLSS